MQLQIYRVIFLIGLLVISKPLYAESDIVGWGKAKWGMSHSELSKLFEIAAWEQADPPTCKLKNRIKILGHGFAVAFYFDRRSPEGKLYKITLVHFDPNTKDTSWLETIKELLVEKYGNPTLFEINADIKKSKWLKSEGQLGLSTVTGNTIMCAIEYVSTRVEGEKL